MNKNLEIFVSFARIGAMTFGGGYAMIPILRKEVIDIKGWISEEQMMDAYAIAQVSPGIIAVNTSALIGFQLNRKKGALSAALGQVFPSILIITLIAAFLQEAFLIPVIAQIFAAIRIAVAALIIHTATTLFKKGIIDIFSGIIFTLAFVAIVIFAVSPVYIVILSAVFGILVKSLQGRIT
ncbi:MAG: chromate transporter [Firmicutes bacterium HGW-Firmicutes-19]|jgi:chromate transporter|nr:MAG: chromate transporter [Firmicutes bacterium HGW-Firmicutes-19]